MEAWPGFCFLAGRSFDLGALRTVQQMQAVPVTDLKTEPIWTMNEQADKADLMIYPDGEGDTIQTWGRFTTGRPQISKLRPAWHLRCEASVAIRLQSIS